MNKSESKYFNTALLMNQALIELLNKKDYDYITVQEICKKAGVNRSTFYLHYENIDDLLYESIEHTNKNFDRYFPQYQKEISQNIQTANLQDLMFLTPEYLFPYLKYIKENKVIYQVSIKHPTKMKSIEKYNFLNKNILFPIFQRFGIEEKRYKYLSAFYINGITAIINEWIKNDCKDELEYICNTIIDCCPKMDK